MSEEKIVYTLDINIPLHKPFVFIPFKEHDVVVLFTLFEALYLSQSRPRNAILNYKSVGVSIALTLVHNLNFFLLQFMVLISDKNLRKYNLEVNI